MAAMNDCLLKEVETGKDEITHLREDGRRAASLRKGDG